jgi:uncharacterized protein (UPF0548 family)
VNVLFFRQSPRLEDWKRRPFSPGVTDGSVPSDNFDRHEGVVGVEPPGPPLEDGPYVRVRRAILDFRIFPEKLATPVVERTPLQFGDALGLRYGMFPFVSIFFASRVIDVIDEQREGKLKQGFTYRTLDGHMMLGEETFLVEKNLHTGEVKASLEAWSRPRHWLTRAGYWYARRCQLQAGRRAIRNLQSLAREREDHE